MVVLVGCAILGGREEVVDGYIGGRGPFVYGSVCQQVPSIGAGIVAVVSECLVLMRCGKAVEGSRWMSEALESLYRRKVAPMQVWRSKELQMTSLVVPSLSIFQLVTSPDCPRSQKRKGSVHDGPSQVGMGLEQTSDSRENGVPTTATSTTGAE